MDLTQDETKTTPAGSNPQPTTQDDLAAALAGVQGLESSQNDRALHSQEKPNEEMDFEPFGEPEFTQSPQAAPQSPPSTPPPSLAPTLSAEQQVQAPQQSQQPETQESAITQNIEQAPHEVDSSTPQPQPYVSDNPSPETNTPIQAAEANTQSEPTDNNTIEAIKNSALKQLRPLMQHIELNPEEKFEKYLMMLRASDDPTLIEPAYKAAQQITSEKLKAQALLDVINEINYISATAPAL